MEDTQAEMKMELEKKINVPVWKLKEKAFKGKRIKQKIYYQESKIEHRI